MKRILAGCLFVALLLAGEKEDPADRVIDRIVAGEQQFLASVRQLKPILETYIQELPEGGPADAQPVTDHYMVGRLDLSNGLDYTVFGASAAFQRRSSLWLLRKGAPLSFSAAGFAQMTLPDAEEFDRQTYGFEYVRREFLGDLRCLVFDVAPKSKKVAGKFVGRIWVEDKEFRIVRFNGTYSGSKSSAIFFHFDSWRMEVAPGLWAPVSIYVEDAGTPARKTRFKAQTRLWGYHARSSKQGELTAILIDAERPVKDESGSKDVSPLESERSWKRQAEGNVIDRLEKNGLLALRGEVDRVLNTVVSNLIVTNNLNVEVQCRVLLTTPLETFTIGQTIVISRGLLDVLPDEASLAMVLSDELAHIALGHPTETMFAFSDRTMFAEKEILARLRFARTGTEIEAAGKKAAEILLHSPYKGKFSSAGLFLKALESRAPKLPNLIQANFGNRLASTNRLLRLAELAAGAPALDENRLDQIAALPLGSRIKVDPWTNQITMLRAKPVTLLTAREKMPFEVTPVVIHLTRN